MWIPSWIHSRGFQLFCISWIQGLPGWRLVVKNLPAKAGDTGGTCLIPGLGRSLWRKEMATHFSILARIILWTEEPGGLSSLGLQRVGHDWSNTHASLDSKCFKGMCRARGKKRWFEMWSSDTGALPLCAQQLRGAVPSSRFWATESLVGSFADYSQLTLLLHRWVPPNACKGIPEQRAATVRGPDSRDSQHVSVCGRSSTRVGVTTPDTEGPTVSHRWSRPPSEVVGGRHMDGETRRSRGRLG